jgi:hypothetical protein
MLTYNDDGASFRHLDTRRRFKSVAVVASPLLPQPQQPPPPPPPPPRYARYIHVAAVSRRRPRDRNPLETGAEVMSGRRPYSWQYIRTLLVTHRASVNCTLTSEKKHGSEENRGYGS